MYLLLAALALADAAMEAPSACSASLPTGSVPAHGDVDVPVDVQPALVFPAGACGDLAWTLRLIRRADEAEIAWTDTNVTQGLAELPLAEALDAETDYLLLVTSGRQEAVIGFTTGSGAAEELDGRPTVEALAATWQDGEGLVTTDATASTVREAAIVRFLDDGGAVFTSMAEGGAASFTWRNYPGERPMERCVTVEERDPAGAWTASKRRCVDVVDTDEHLHSHGSCGTGLAPGLLSAAAGLIAALFRRKER